MLQAPQIEDMADIEPRRDAGSRLADSSACGVFQLGTGNVHAELPWQASVAVVQKNNKKMHLCSAVILSQRHVLTPASCLTEYPMRKYRVVTAGRNEGDGEQELSIQSIFTHDNYDEATSENDLALVKLKAVSNDYALLFGQFANKEGFIFEHAIVTTIYVMSYLKIRFE